MEQIMNNIHMNQLCKVCGEPAAGFHFGAFTCEGCKSFFGRTYNNVSGVSECKNGGRCEITKKNRTSCKSCRLRKCLSVGMSKSGSRYGRRSNWFKIHCLLSAQSQNGLSSSPETNNNNTTVTNNNNTSPNNNNNNNHHHVTSKNLPSTITSIGGRGGHGHGHSHGHGHGHSGSEPDRDRDRDRHHQHSRDRTTSSVSNPPHRLSHNNSGPLPFANLAALSPDSKEHFLSSLNRKMMNPDLCDYFRSAANANSPTFPLSNGLGLGAKPFYPDDGTEDMSRTTRSPGSLESPNSEASAEDTKSRHTPLFTMPPGSPLDVKPNDVLSFDLLTRDLLKLGYDPLRLWPAMLTTPPSLHQFNPYRFMFPNFPNAAAAAAAAASAGFPGGPGGTLPNGVVGSGPTPPIIPNGNLLTSNKLLSAACASASAENLTNPSQNRRFPSFVPAASSLTLTPPISHHGSEDPPSIPPVTKFRNLPVQEKPIDLSAKGNNNNNNNNNSNALVKVKREIIDHPSPNISDDEDNSSDENSFSDHEIKEEHKSELGDSDQENEELGEDGDDEDSFHHQGRRRRSSSASSHIPKRVRVSTPLDLTRTSNNTNSNPPTKIAT